MFLKNTLRLFWWNEIKLQGKSKENYGDLLGKYLVEKISHKKIVWVKPSVFSIYNLFMPIYVTVGSILSHVNYKCIVWGSGIISRNHPVKKAKFLAVRGPQTRKYLLQQGHDVPEIYGDPALLLPKYYSPEIKKEFKIGIIPHYRDFKKVENFYDNESSVLLIDLMTNDIEKTTSKFLKCEKIVSSSLHGIIVAHAYGIPAVWQKFSNDVFGDDIKYQDYFESVEIPNYNLEIKDVKMDIDKLLSLFNGVVSIPETKKIEALCSNLMAVCPFKA